MAAVAVDADVLIEFLDPGDIQHERAVAFLRPWLGAGHRVHVAASVYAEILVRPLRVGLGAAIDAFIADMRIEIVPIDRAIARRAAGIRAEHDSLRLPDALALACALELDAAFLTLDRRLRHIADGLA